MRKFLFLFYFLFCTQYLYGGFTVSYLEDKQNYQNIHEVIEKTFTLSTPKKTLGSKKFAWLKVSIINDNKKEQENYLSLTNLQIMEDVHFFTVVNGKVIKENTSFNKYTNYNVPNRVGKTLIYKNDLKINQNIDVFIYITAKSTIFYEIENGTFDKVLSSISKSTAIITVLVGILLSLGIYYLFLGVFTPNKEYVYYILFVFSLALWGFYIHGGYAYYFNNFTMGAISNVLVYFLPLCTILFFKAIYQNVIEFSIYNKILNILAGLLIVLILIYLITLSSFFSSFSVGKYGPIIYLVNIIIVMIIVIIIYIKRFPFSGIFLLAYSLNFIGSLISICFFLGLIPYNILTLHANMIGGAFEAIFFSILLTAKLKEVYEHRDKAQTITKIQKLKIKTMNNVINFISHQWRQPLSQINSAVLLVDDELYVKNVKNPLIEEKLNEIERMTKYMSETIDDFRKIYSNDKIKECFYLYLTIEKAIHILENYLDIYQIKIDKKLDNTIKISDSQNNFQQIILVILNNAKDALLSTNTKNPKISISLEKNKETILLQISDNAGGIELNDIDNIFNPYFTTKQKSEGAGLGLYMAKIIIEENMNGKISVENKNGGANFKITLKDNNE